MTTLPNKPNLRPDEKKGIDMTDLPEKKLLCVREAAQYFGVHERTVRLWIKCGKLFAEKLAGSVRISRESIVKFRESGRDHTSN